MQLGPRAMGLAVEMKQALGGPYRKVGHILSTRFGLRVSPGGLARGGQRVAHQAEPTYDQLLVRLRQQEGVYGDETSWWVAGHKAWLGGLPRRK